MPVVVSDASPLVNLSAIRRFDLLRALFGEIVLPPSVWSEVVEAGENRPGEKEVRAAVRDGWARVKEPSSPVSEPLGRLDLGEAQALALALELSADLVLIDELRGREIARSLKLRAMGTLGVLLKAKECHLIVVIRPELDALQRDSEMYLRPELLDFVLRLASET